MHLLRMQARFRGQSEFITHSGRQATYGSPLYSGMQEHTPLLQLAFDPHGNGLHGSSATGTGSGDGIIIHSFQ